MTVRCFASSLASVVQLVVPARIAADHRAAGAAVGDLAGLDVLPGAAPLPGGGRAGRGGAGDAAGHQQYDEFKGTRRKNIFFLTYCDW